MVDKPKIEIPEWVNRARIEYENGASDVEVCRILGITKHKFDSYYTNNTEFRKFIDLGRMLSAAWWAEQGRKNLTNRAFNTSLWSFNMKNRFGWAEKVEQNSGANAPEDQLSIDNMRTKIKEYQSRLLKLEGLSEAEVLQITSKQKTN